MTRRFSPKAGVEEGPRLIDIQRIRTLPQSPEAWQLAVRDAPQNCDPARLYRVLVLVSPGDDVVRQMLPLTRELGDEGEIVGALEEGMLVPPNNLGPVRPSAIWVDDERVAERISLPMASCGVQVVVKAQLPAIDPVLEGLARRSNLFSDGPLFGTMVLEEELAQAAARVAAVEPWRYFRGEVPIEVRDQGEGGLARSIVVVLGQLREVEGVASYDSEEAYVQISSLGGKALVSDSRMCVNSLAFERASEVLPEVRGAFRRRGLPVVHGLFPTFMHLALSAGRPDVLRRPRAARRLLRDLHAVATLIERDGDRIAEGTWQRSCLTYAGRQLHLIARRDITTRVRPPTPPVPTAPEAPAVDEQRVPHLLTDTHSLLVSDLPLPLVAELLPAERLDALCAGEQPGTVRALVVKATKRVVRRACRDMAGIDTIGFTGFREMDGRSHEVVIGYRTGEPMFVLASVPESDDVPRLSEVVAGDDPASLLLVVFVGGGARRGIARLKASAVVGAYALPHRKLAH